MKTSFPEYFMRLAFMAATRASCDRKKVGAVVVSPDKRIVSTGYNGAPAGVDDCDTVGHTMVQTGIDTSGQPKMSCIATIHAETNAIAFAGRAANGCDLYVTVTPCADCSKLIVNAGICRVYYADFYSSRYGKSETTEEYLVKAGVEVIHYESPGLTIFRQQMDEVDRIERDLLRNTQIDYLCGCAITADVATARCPTHNKGKMAHETGATH